MVLFVNSNTQRVTAEVNEDENWVLLSKEWRKTSEDDWNIGKGIKFQTSHLVNLGKILSCRDESQLNKMLSDYELLQEDKHDNLGGKSPNNRD